MWNNDRSDLFNDDELSFNSSLEGPGEVPIRPLTVGALTTKIKNILNASFDTLLVQGEISGFSVVRSGHAYFTLKDEKAQLPAVIWASSLRRLQFMPKNGMKVVCIGRLDLYEPQGKYQFIATEVEQIGLGSWEKRFRELHAKFEKEGLFDRSRKKPLPLFVKRVGVATSLTGAALRDFVNTLAKYSKGIEVVVAPTRVQGPGAALEIAAALRALNNSAEALGLDVISLIRGGGSVEDLWEFNEEVAVRAVAESKVPVITGIGHEIDNSLCDFAAVRSAVTPTAAAGAIIDLDFDCFEDIRYWEERANSFIESRLNHARERLQSLEKRPVFQAPGQIIWERKKDLLDQMKLRLDSSVNVVYNRHESRFRESTGRLEAMSPLKVLGRGYSITKNLNSDKILHKASDVRNGDILETRLEEGVLRSLVLEGGSPR